jgi:hypothetical protein
MRPTKERDRKATAVLRAAVAANPGIRTTELEALSQVGALGLRRDQIVKVLKAVGAMSTRHGADLT